MRIKILCLFVSALLIGGVSVHAEDFDGGSDQEPTTPVTGYAFKSSAIMPTPTPSPIPVVRENKAPRADAGPSQSVSTGALVVLTGSNSKDPEGAALSYAWRQLSGPRVELLSSRTAHPSFSSGTISASYIFQLTVRDDKGSSAIDVVTVAVQRKVEVASPSPTIPPISPSPTPDTALSITTPFSFMNIILVLLVVFLLVLVIIFGRVAFAVE